MSAFHRYGRYYSLLNIPSVDLKRRFHNALTRLRAHAAVYADYLRSDVQ